MYNLVRHKPLVIALTVTVVLSTVFGACAAPTPQVVEKIVEKQVEKVVTQVVEKPVIQTQVVEKAVVVTATPAPTVAGADLAADQTIHYVTRGFSRMDPAPEGGFGRFIIAYLFMPLFVHDNKHNIMPWLATGYEVNADMTVYTVKINPKAVWSDGSPVTAQEAKDYWTYALDPKACIGCYFGLFTGFGDVVEGAREIIDGKGTELTGVVVKDEKTLEFRLKASDPIFPHRLALFDAGFAKMEDVKKQQVKIGENMVFNANAETRFNGPYMIKVW
ncbi:MAG: ABC transporter substrate-binding protein, partial [Anaerolineae bacterium]|nr:ABC transporter substrate-binding protein [Anaerolineae bacterium]